MNGSIAFLRHLLNVIYNTPADGGWGVPVHFEGDPGVAKTAICSAFARSLGTPFLHLNAAQKGEGYFGVVPVPTLKDGAQILTFPANGAIAEMVDRGNGVILFDELLSAPRSIRPAMLGTCQERIFGDVQLPPGVRIFAASNPEAVAVNGVRMSPPEANRFCHLPWPSPSPEEMLSYHTSRATHWKGWEGSSDDLKYLNADHEKEILKVWGQAYAAATNEVFQFTKIYKASEAKEGDHRGASILHRMPDPRKVEAAKAWPSPRSWSNACYLLASTRLHYPGESDLSMSIAAALVGGCVGEKVADEFFVWLKAQDLPDFEAWLTGRAAPPVFNPERVDRNLVILTGAAKHCVATSAKNADAMTEFLWKELVRAINEIPGEAPILGAKEIIKAARDSNADKSRTFGMSSKAAAEFTRLSPKVLGG